MSEQKNIFIRLMELFKNQPRLITTETVSKDTTIGTSDRLVAPVNGLVLVDGKCGNRAIIKHGDVETYIVVSTTKVLFNEIQYAMVIAVQQRTKDGMTQRRISYAMSNADTLAIRCDGGDPVFNCVAKDSSFINNPQNHTVVKYIATNQPAIYMQQKFAVNIVEKLTFDIQEEGLIVKVKAKTPQKAEPSQ